MTFCTNNYIVACVKDCFRNTDPGMIAVTVTLSAQFL